MALSDAPLLEDSRPLAPTMSAPSAMRKWVIAFSVILCALLEVLDSSIVNVALPHMQGSFSASVDEGSVAQLVEKVRTRQDPAS